jgi:NADPH:quinone reductase-like Zn-dependent oxidoreductase
VTRGAGAARATMKAVLLTGHGRLAVGEGVPESLVDERVLVDFVRSADDGESLVGASVVVSERDGGFAGYVAVPAGNAPKLIVVPREDA